MRDSPWTGAITLSTAATATTGGYIALIPSGSFSSGSAYTFLQAAGGLAGANYFVSNPNYTATLSVSSTGVTVTPATATPLGTAYWYGGLLPGEPAAMALSNGTLSNWSTTQAP